MDGRKNQAGFTLVELMVVVLIIGVLVAVAVPIFISTNSTARIRTCQSNQRLIEGAAQQYAATAGHMWTQAHRFNGNGTADTVDVLVPDFIKTAPKCPESGLYYYVEASGTITGDINAAGWAPDHSHY